MKKPCCCVSIIGLAENNASYYMITTYCGELTDATRPEIFDFDVERMRQLRRSREVNSKTKLAMRRVDRAAEELAWKASRV